MLSPLAVLPPPGVGTVLAELESTNNRVWRAVCFLFPVVALVQGFVGIVCFALPSSSNRDPILCIVAAIILETLLAALCILVIRNACKNTNAELKETRKVSLQPLLAGAA
ncbi:MAG: hypothetical protein KR126chlam2_00403 [Chlamydiae bacterium]|nr:hypothetical protein [Chlamydiota bacterium]